MSAGHYLSRLPIGDRVGLYAAHCAVYEACGRESRPLWRRCPGYVLVLSTQPVAGQPSRPYDPSPRVGQPSRFDLLAEVVVAKKSDGRSRGKRVDPVLEARIANPSRPYAQLAREHGTKWLQRRAEAFGFDIAELERCDYEVMEFVREGQPIRLSTINFAGRLRVTDPERFRAALLQGVGHGKAWGCGLLLCMKR